MLANKYLKYRPEITLEIFTLVYYKLIESGLKSLSLKDTYNYFKDNHPFLTICDKHYEITCY